MKQSLRSRFYANACYKILAITSACLFSMGLQAQELSAAFTESAWQEESVPEGQQCQRFGGKNPQSPEVKVENIPEDADAIVLEFSDRSVERMDNGGHGKVGYKLSGERDAVTVPSVPGHTMDLPEGFFTVEAQRAPGWDTAGAYLPPCSGGRGNDYFIDVKAVKLGEGQTVSEVLTETSIKMGVY